VFVITAERADLPFDDFTIVRFGHAIAIPASSSRCGSLHEAAGAGRDGAGAGVRRDNGGPISRRSGAQCDSSSGTRVHAASPGCTDRIKRRNPWTYWL
jgi:hypothetical protein